MPTNSYEKAQQGTKLLKEAILEYLETKPEGVSSAQIREDLGLDNEMGANGKRSDKLLWGLYNLLLEEEKVRIDRRVRPQRWFLTGR